MANPAELLLRLFRSWESSTSASVQSVRADDQLREHRRAVGYLDSIDEALALLEKDGKNVGIYRRNFPYWVGMVFNYPRSWGESNRGVMNSTAIDHLETLVDRIDDVSPKIEIDKVPILLLYLDAVKQALADDDSLPIAVRRQVTLAIRHIQKYVAEIDYIDPFDFQRAISELFAALALAVLQSKQRERWAGWAENFVWMGVGDVFSTMADYTKKLAANSEVLQQALTTG